MRSSSYLWGCDRALTALPGQLCRGLLYPAPEVRHGESPHAEAAASREKEKEEKGEGGGKGRARSGYDRAATQRQRRRGHRTVPCPAKYRASTEGRASAPPGRPAASDTPPAAPPQRPRPGPSHLLESRAVREPP